MVLREALSNISDYICDKWMLEDEVRDIVISSKNVKKGDLYISLKEDIKNQKRARMALDKGAVGIVTGKPIGLANEIVVKDVRKAYALISKAMSGNACDDLKLIAVTGTNGKTTTTKIISDILRLSGKKVGVIGTLGVGEGDELVDTGFTTPDPEILHKTFRKMKERGCEYVVMEASAHALALDKLEGLNFDISIFTNLTQDHLDFFGDMENYYRAKQKLFSSKLSKMGIVFGDDKYGQRLLNNPQIPLYSYGISEKFDGSISDMESSFSGSRLKCKLLGEDFELESKLCGEYNMQNLLAACLTSRFLGVTDEQMKNAVKKIEPAEGRFNKIDYNGATVIIDFAHTPDGLEKVLKTAREMTKSRLLCVFGCGGNRDRLKRPMMGKITEELCDEVYITSDNPRFEKPMDIIEEIEEGMKKDNHKKFTKREEAIAHALRNCHEGDCLVIAGKGGEKYQDINGIKEPYDDFEVVYKNIAKLQTGKGERVYGK